MPLLKLCDDLPAIPVVTGGTNLNALSNDEPAESMTGCGFECCCDATPICESNRIKSVGKHLFHYSCRIA
ncbi:MAG TPA: hypothetical protein VKP30_21305 [Polyangiaceae bacterium]|nr:hypothetical protein [Polyangiaceae bacterium]